MGKQIMICGVDCHKGDVNCNGYCTGKADCAADATDAMVLERAREAAHRALDTAEHTWYEYAGLCDVGAGRTHAFDIYQKVRMSRHTQQIMAPDEEYWDNQDDSPAFEERAR